MPKEEILLRTKNLCKMGMYETFCFIIASENFHKFLIGGNKREP